MNMDDPRVAENLSELACAFARTSDSKLIEQFFECILTPAETADIAARWALVKALDKKVPQREIAKNLGLSLCKITRGSRELKKPNSAFRNMLTLTAEKEKEDEGE
ncbi:MAG: trp operon repressor [Treponema sp.]|jgi:TrpR family trp operon transcriptional repressor|nr:trp operon repressor [Treponema sp.]